MSDLIPLAELLAEIDREIKRVPACAATLQRARSIALTIPTVDAEPVVNAEWILHQEIGFGEADKECSACGTMSLISSHRCHRCGARMDAPERVGEGQRAALEGGQHGSATP